jgi:hypothetical protein
MTHVDFVRAVIASDASSATILSLNERNVWGARGLNVGATRLISLTVASESPPSGLGRAAANAANVYACCHAGLRTLGPDVG